MNPAVVHSQADVESKRLSTAVVMADKGPGSGMHTLVCLQVMLLRKDFCAACVGTGQGFAADAAALWPTPAAPRAA